MAHTPRLTLLVCLAVASVAAHPLLTGEALTPAVRPLTAWGAPTLDDQVRAIASRLRCPVCQNESVADSPSELAAQMRALIRTRLQNGESPDAIVAYFVSRYGEWILLDPPRRGLGWLLWTAPGIALALGLLVAVAFVRRAVRRGAEGATSEEPVSVKRE
jgi:cytochrome c-type biogenesis protein CcmH